MLNVTHHAIEALGTLFGYKQNAGLRILHHIHEFL